MYCYSNDGVAFRRVGAKHVAQHGEVVFSSPPTETELAVAFPGYTKALKRELVAYARGKQKKLARGGIAVNIGSISAPLTVNVSTDAESLVLLQYDANAAHGNPSATFPMVQDDGGVLMLTSAQIIALYSAASAFIAATRVTLAAVVAAINAGSITDRSQIETLPTGVVPAWPVNS